jgi:hypothetical protein
MAQGSRQENVEEGRRGETGISPPDTSTIEFIVSRPWFDLVCPEEYFDAHRGLHLLTSNLEHTTAFWQRYEPRLPLGDYVARGLFARIDYWKAILDRVWRQVFCSLTGAASDEYQVHERLFSTKIELDQSLERLTVQCRSGDGARRREACTALTQIYVAYAPAPSLEWLGCPPGLAAHREVIRSYVRRRNDVAGTGQRSPRLCDPDVLRQLAGSLEDVVPLYHVPEEPEELIEWSRDSARLVLVDRSPRAVFWEGKAAAEGQWDAHPTEWNLLWTLALHCRRPVDQEMLANPERHRIRSRRKRLSTLLKETLDLDERIETLRGQGYQLSLAAEDIILLRDDGFGRLMFEGRGRDQVI